MKCFTGCPYYYICKTTKRCMCTGKRFPKK